MNDISIQKVFGPATRQRVLDLETHFKQLPQRELKVLHHFSKGVYARELHIPADTILTGEIHKFENLNILSQGEISVSMEDGSMKRVSAPFTIVSPPGTKRIAYTHSDCIWTTIHGTDEKDLNIIEQFFIAKSEAEYLEFCGQQRLELSNAAQA